MRDEFSRVYASLFEDPARHEAIIRALAKKRGGLTRNELLKALALPSGGSITRCLEELEESGFVARSPQWGRITKHSLFRVADEYSLFYLAWIERHRGDIGDVWLNKRYADILRHRRELFRQITGTKKTLFTTMVTTFELVDTQHANELVDISITMDALFR